MQSLITRCRDLSVHHELGHYAREQNCRNFAAPDLVAAANCLWIIQYPVLRKLHRVGRFDTRDGYHMFQPFYISHFFTLPSQHGVRVSVWNVKINGSFQTSTHRKKWIGPCENEILGFFLYIYSWAIFQWTFSNATLLPYLKRYKYIWNFSRISINITKNINNIFLLIEKWLFLCLMPENPYLFPRHSISHFQKEQFFLSLKKPIEI